ncbi:MAG: preprotein translocase subunit YajC, partial [Ruminococcaceae bacterium]|nr:preprotein translocase subunit YajC [Oscillospiraceae bacterium]
ERAANEMRNSLQRGDEITTIGGIVGKIVGMTDETITIETSNDKTKIRFLKSAVRSVDVKANEAQGSEQ